MLADVFTRPVALFAAALVVVVGWLVWAFNRLVRDRNLLGEAWSGIDVQLKTRHNLILNLAETVKAYAAYEQNLFKAIAELRAGLADDARPAQAAVRENALTDNLRGLLALAENYPDLKASENFLNLQQRLVEIEDKIQMARRYYNGAARNYNIRVESFPSNIAAGAFRFRPAEFFQVETATHRHVLKVRLNGAGGEVAAAGAAEKEATECDEN